MFSPLLLFFLILPDILFTWSGLLMYILNVNDQIPTVSKNDFKNTYYQEMENKGKPTIHIVHKNLPLSIAFAAFVFCIYQP